MSLTETKLQITGQYGIPSRLAALQVNPQKFASRLEQIKQQGLLWIIQRGHNLRLLREKSPVFETKLRELSAFVSSADAALAYFGFADAVQRQDLIFQRLSPHGGHSDFARNLERLRIVYETAGLEVAPEDRARILAAMRVSTRKHSFTYALSRALVRTARQSPDKLGEIYNKMGVSPQKQEALRALRHRAFAARIINMREADFEERWRLYNEGMNFSYTNSEGEVVIEHFDFRTTDGMLDHVLVLSPNLIRQRLTHLRSQGVIVITPTRLGEKTTRHSLSLADNYCEAGASAVLRGDYETALGHYRKAITFSQSENNEGKKVLARRGLERTTHLQAAVALEAGGDQLQALDRYEKAMCVLGDRASRTKVGNYTRERALALFAGGGQELIREEVGRSIRGAETAMGSEETKWLLDPAALKLREANEAEVLTVAQRLSSTPPRYQTAQPAIALELALGARQLILERYCRQGEESLASAFLLLHISKRRLFLSNYSVLEARAKEILLDFRRRRKLPFSPDRLLAELQPYYSRSHLAFAACLYNVAGLPITVASLRNFKSINFLLGRLTRWDFGRRRRALYQGVLDELLSARGILVSPAYLKKIHPASLVRKILLYENAGISFSGKYWWQLNTADKVIRTVHIPHILRMRAKAGLIEEKMPSTPEYLRRRISTERFLHILALADQYGIRFLLEAGHLFSHFIQSPQNVEAELGGIAQKVRTALEILGFYGLGEPEAKGFLAAQYGDFFRIKLITLLGMQRLYLSAGIHPQGRIGQIVDVFREEFPFATWHFDRVVAQAKRERRGVEIIMERKPVVLKGKRRAEPDKEELKELLRDIRALWTREIHQYPDLVPEEQDDLLRRAQLGETTAKKQLVEAYLKYVPDIARGALRWRRYSPQSQLFLDMVQEGNRALVEAVESYPGVGTFRSHVRMCIQRAVREAYPRHRGFLTLNERIARSEDTEDTKDSKD